MRRTKILATLGPASSSPEKIEALIRAGVNGFRLNFSHGTHETHAGLYRAIREASARVGVPVAILQDLQGPKIRTGNLVDGKPVTLVAGQSMTISVQECLGTAQRVSTTYQALPSDVKAGDTILLDDGLMSLKVLSTTATGVEAQVAIGGELGEHKGINLPGVALSTPSLTEKDREDAAFGLSLGVDYIALSFVRKPSDIDDLRQLVRAAGKSTPIVAKIEKPEAIEQLEEVIAQSDGVMVARGDLGVEVSVERVPVLQKRIIAESNRQGKLVITATQMLESMIANPIPTRAEATDIANAILDGTDVVMLSGETAKGKYPVESVTRMGQIAEETERELVRYYDTLDRIESSGERLTKAAVDAACFAAREVVAAAIVVFTRSGRTALMASKERPACRTVALTPEDATYRRLALAFGVDPVKVDFVERPDDLIQAGERVLLERRLARHGDTVIMLAGTSTARGATNLVKVHRVGELSA